MRGEDRDVPLSERVESLLAPDGELPRRWTRYEERAAQRRLAADIARVIEHGGVLLAEAPTGVGKSLAYLLPAVLHARADEARVVVATCTRSLQDQLFERDLPALLESLDLRLACARLKGKQNYLCPRALALSTGRGSEEEETLEELRRWAASDEEGDLDRFPASDPEAMRRLRGRLGADPHACTMLTCRKGRECYWVRARRAAAQARIVIVNHALLALSGEVDGLLPDFDVLIVDEAHRLEGVLLGQLEVGVSRNRIEEVLRLLGAGRRRRGRGVRDEAGGAGLLTRVRGFALPLFAQRQGGADAEQEELDALGRRVTQARADADRFFAAIEPRSAGHALYGTRERYRSALELLGRDLEPLESILAHCSRFARSLHLMAEGLDALAAGETADELVGELEQVAGRFGQLGADLGHLAEATHRDWVYWRSSGGRGVELHGSPVSVGDHARRLVLGRARAAVLTSATLSTGGDFGFLAERLGLGESWGMPYETASYPSPFALERQMKVFVFEGGDGEAEAVSEVVAELARATGRNQLVLFTAHERLRRARERLLGGLGAAGPLLAQEWDGPASLLAERFRLERGAVLLGVQSLWEGVDFPGEALEILVVAKLPFSVPDEPLVEARGERLREQGLEPFQHDAVPEAVLRFRQGVGRLIRRSDDRGVLVVCDPRLVTASYRRAFLEALPVAPERTRDARALAAAAARFFAAPAPAEAAPGAVTAPADAPSDGDGAPAPPAAGRAPLTHGEDGTP
jgi:Rad3-related DNA helicase